MTNADFQQFRTFMPGYHNVIVSEEDRMYLTKQEWLLCRAFFLCILGAVLQDLGERVVIELTLVVHGRATKHLLNLQPPP